VGGVGRRRPVRRGGLGRSLESLTDGPASINSRARIHRRTRSIRRRRRRLEGLLGVARRQEKTNYKKIYIYIIWYIPLPPRRPEKRMRAGNIEKSSDEEN